MISNQNVFFTTTVEHSRGGWVVYCTLYSQAALIRNFNNPFYTTVSTYAQIRPTLRTLYPNMDKKVWTSTLLSNLPTYPKSLEILESKFALFQIFLFLFD